jgi:para-nitrobenzyl esterase
MAPFGRGKVALAAVTVAALLASSAPAPAQAKSPACSSGTLVHARSGPVCGVTKKGQTDYLDIRYAAPPVGTLRWAPPQSMKPSTTTYRATRRGASCAQPTFPSGKLEKAPARTVCSSKFRSRRTSRRAAGCR